MTVKLIEPITGGIVEAYDETAAQRLVSKGFKRFEEKPKRTPRKRTSVKKEK